MDVLGGNWLGDKEIGYFKLTVTDWYFSGVEYLAIQATQDSFGSDPDLFISRTNTRPSSTADSEFACVKRGTDTCVL